MQNTYSPSDCVLVRETASELRRQLAAVASCEHDQERAALVDQLQSFLAPRPGRTIRNIAHELMDDQIEEVIAEFISATPQFYRTTESAQRSAENCPTVAELQHRRRLLDESPSIEMATLLEFVLSQAINDSPDFQPDTTPAGKAPTGQPKGTQSQPTKTA